MADPVIRLGIPSKNKPRLAEILLRCLWVGLPVKESIVEKSSEKIESAKRKRSYNTALKNERRLV